MGQEKALYFLHPMAALQGHSLLSPWISNEADVHWDPCAACAETAGQPSMGTALVAKFVLQCGKPQQCHTEHPTLIGMQSSQPLQPTRFKQERGGRGTVIGPTSHACFQLTCFRYSR